MPVLQPHEYDISYFDGGNTSLAHNAGYRKYKRWYRQDPGTFPNIVVSNGEYFKDVAETIAQIGILPNKEILEIGCAYGYLVEDLRSLGVSAFGLDVSQYAYDQASAEAKPYITVADARTHLSTYRANEFDAVISRRFMCCMDDADLPDLIGQMNRISKRQIHIIDTRPKEDYYNKKVIEDWFALDWDRGTILIPFREMRGRYVK